ncbi:hypothetical protein SASPL_136463 [Salvia splendens]|uniref:Uncharacterized protein n=1 Tax=Salvia splendens TaxID=180675 RepID=A0A8X8X277_SALSN|nr:hypothetical protein SASPL_136463 [Salvia splendens]
MRRIFERKRGDVEMRRGIFVHPDKDSSLSVMAVSLLRGCLLGLLRSVVKCPVCESWVYKLVPLLPALVQPGREEEASEILGEIEQFNTEDELRREFGELDELLREKKQNREDSIVFRIFMKYGDLIEGVTKALVCLLWFSFVLKQFVNIIIDFRLWPNGTCVLQFSILMDDFRKFKCSKCESQVYNLVPHSPVLTQPGRGVAEVLGEILQFNGEHKKEVDLLQSMRGMPDFMLDNLPSVYTLIQYADAVYDFRLWPNGMYLFGLDCIASYTGIFEAFDGIEWRSIMDSVAGKCVFEQDFQKDAIYVFVKFSTVYSFLIDMIMD